VTLGLIVGQRAAHLQFAVFCFFGEICAVTFQALCTIPATEYAPVLDERDPGDLNTTAVTPERVFVPNHGDLLFRKKLPLATSASSWRGICSSGNA
jgi:hypothetical protein